MRVAVTIVLALLCSPAGAADPWKPLWPLFPGKSPPVVVAPLPPVVELPPLVEVPPPIMVPEPEEAPPHVAVPLPVPKPPAPMPKKAKAKPISLAPCLGPPLAQSCATVCDYATRYTTQDLMALRALGIATGQVENRPVSCQEEEMGKACIAKYCRSTAKR